MSARRYTQAQVARTFADARKAADNRSDTVDFRREAFILGYVEAALGVDAEPPVVVSA
jgi:hypothetical protein